MNQLEWPVVFALAGALVYALVPSPKPSELGRLTFFAAMIWLAYAMSHGALRF